eukprot:57156-Chlamydomonas_euryale.AAC.2
MPSFIDSPLALLDRGLPLRTSLYSAQGPFETKPRNAGYAGGRKAVPCNTCRKAPLQHLQGHPCATPAGSLPLQHLHAGPSQRLQGACPCNICRQALATPAGSPAGGLRGRTSSRPRRAAAAGG